MACVFQEPLLCRGSVLYNARLACRPRGVARPEADRRALDWLGAWGSAALADRPVDRLSGGEAQRTSLARAFAAEPEVLFLDEPFAALDAPTREALLDDLGRLLAATETTTVLVTHDRAEALRLGDRVAVLLEGRLAQIGPPGQVFGAPADEAVARFVGVENLLPGRVLAVKDGLPEVDVGPDRGSRSPAPPRPGSGSWSAAAGGYHARPARRGRGHQRAEPPRRRIVRGSRRSGRSGASGSIAGSSSRRS